MARGYKPSPSAEEVLTVLAHVYVVADIDKKVPNAAGFFDFYIANALTERQRAIWETYKKTCHKVRADIVKLLEKEKV
ncbi:hypothetical protein [Methylocaldum gracile]|jgi:hypothetical protein|uniref:hypothetical protein n=1 Tax=unclassified Methylocaldum TaxID=2622260 RepID=UPI00105B83CE